MPKRAIRLDYMTPEEAPVHATVPISFWLACMQIPWLFMTSLIVAIGFGGITPRHTLRDLFWMLVLAAPGIAALFFSLRECWTARRHHRRFISLFLSLLSCAEGLGIVIIMVWAWRQ